MTFTQQQTKPFSSTNLVKIFSWPKYPRIMRILMNLLPKLIAKIFIIIRRKLKSGLTVVKCHFINQNSAIFAALN